MKRIGILGISGEIGKRAFEILKEEYRIIGSYYSRRPELSGNYEIVQLDVADTLAVQNFCHKCDVIVNCAGASYNNGETIARIAAGLQIPIIDPSGESFLEDKIFDIQEKNIFVLSSGYFPGMSGLLMRFLCESFDTPQEICGLNVAEEIPGKAAMEDFILTNMAGFGLSLHAYINGKPQRDTKERFEIINNKEYRFQNYYTIELDKIVRTFQLKKAHWYNAAFKDNVMKKLQEAIVIYKEQGITNHYKKIIEELPSLFAKNLKNKKNFSYLQTEAKGIANGHTVHRKIKTLASCSSQISAVIIAYTVKAVLHKTLKNGIYYAMNLIDADDLIKNLHQFGISFTKEEKHRENEIRTSNEDYEKFEEGSI